VIPEARVLSVADVVEAIVSYRPYRGSLDLAVALSELRKHRGLWYDAAVVDACLALFDSGNFTFPAEQLPTPA